MVFRFVQSAELRGLLVPGRIVRAALRCEGTAGDFGYHVRVEVAGEVARGDAVPATERLLVIRENDCV